MLLRSDSCTKQALGRLSQYYIFTFPMAFHSLFPMSFDPQGDPIKKDMRDQSAWGVVVAGGGGAAADLALGVDGGARR